MMRVAERITEWLQKHGIDHVFAVTGGGAMFLNQAFGSHPKIKSHYMHHEQACAMAAEGYARISGKPAIVIPTTGPGSINTLNGVFGAYTDSIPMIVISGQVKTETCLSFYDDLSLRQLGDQEGPTIEMVKPICKYARIIRTPKDLEEALPEAFKLAISGRPGPVWLDIPLDIQSSTEEIQIPEIDMALKAKAEGKRLSIGVLCNVIDLLERLIERNITPDLLTDQTSAHDPLNGYYPEGIAEEVADHMRKVEPDKYVEKSLDTMAHHVKLMIELQQKGAIVFDYGNNLRGQAKDQRHVENAFSFPGFVPAYIRPLFCEGKGPFRWVALSGDPNDIYVTDQVMKDLFPENTSLHRWLDMAQERIAFQGLPARICWIGQGDREKAALAFNELVRTGKVKGPIVIGRDHLDTGSVASPNRETEAMKDGSDAVADWPILNSLINTAGGASWVSIHHGGGVGMGYSIHAGMVILADGTEDAARRLKRVLHNDPAMGVIRHADAGYDIAIDTARKHRLDIKERLKDKEDKPGY
jgi:hypothetical protein